MKHKGLVILGVLVAIILIVAALLPFLFDANRYRPEIEARLTKSLGRAVKIGDLKLTLFSGGISASDISIADDPAFSHDPFVQAKSLKVGVQMSPLIFHKQLIVDSLVLQDPVVRLLQNSAGKWNASTIGQNQPSSGTSSENPGDLTVGKLQVSNGRIEVGPASGKQQAYSDLNFTATDVSYNKAFPFNLSLSAPQGGKMKIEGEAGPLAQKDMSRTPFTGNIDIQNFDLAATGFMSPESGLAGIVSYKGKATSDGRKVRSQGRATANKLRVVKGGSSASVPVNVDYSSDYNLASESGVIDNTTIHVGKSAAELSGTYASRGPATDLNLHLVANNMAPQDIEGLLPALGVVLPSGASLQGGAIGANLESKGPSDRLVTAGTINVANTRLVGFSMGQGLSTIAALAGIHAGSDTNIQLLSSNVRVAPEGTRLDNINLVVPELGAMTGSGTIGADTSLNFRLVAKINPSGGGGAIGMLSTALGGKAGGPKQIPIQISGTTSKPVFRPDVSGALASQVGGLLPNPAAGQGQQNGNQLNNLVNGLFGGKKKQ